MKNAENLLKAAKEYDNKSMEYFKYAEHEDDKEMQELWYKWMYEKDAKCAAMLEAYEIITGKKIKHFELINMEF